MKNSIKQKIARIIASMLALAVFVGTNGSFLVWGMSEGELDFFGNQKVARAEEIISGESVSGESNLIGGLPDDEEVDKNNLNGEIVDTQEFSSYLGKKVVGGVVVIDEDDKEKIPAKKVGFFKRLWASIAGMFNRDLKTQILSNIGNEAGERAIVVTEARVVGNVLKFINKDGVVGEVALNKKGVQEINRDKRIFQKAINSGTTFLALGAGFVTLAVLGSVERLAGKTVGEYFIDANNEVKGDATNVNGVVPVDSNGRLIKFDISRKSKKQMMSDLERLEEADILSKKVQNEIFIGKHSALWANPDKKNLELRIVGATDIKSAFNLVGIDSEEDYIMNKFKDGSKSYYPKERWDFVAIFERKDEEGHKYYTLLPGLNSDTSLKKSVGGLVAEGAVVTTIGKVVSPGAALAIPVVKELYEYATEKSSSVGLIGKITGLFRKDTSEERFAALTEKENLTDEELIEWKSLADELWKKYGNINTVMGSESAEYVPFVGGQEYESENGYYPDSRLETYDGGENNNIYSQTDLPVDSRNSQQVENRPSQNQQVGQSDNAEFSWLHPSTWFNKKNEEQTVAEIDALDSFYTVGSEGDGGSLRQNSGNLRGVDTGMQYGPDTLEETQRRNDNFQAPFVSVNNGVLTNSRINSTSYSSGQNSARDARDMENIARDNNRIEELGKKLIAEGLTPKEYTELNNLQSLPNSADVNWVTDANGEKILGASNNSRFFEGVINDNKSNSYNPPGLFPSAENQAVPMYNKNGIELLSSNDYAYLVRQRIASQVLSGEKADDISIENLIVDHDDIQAEVNSLPDIIRQDGKYPTIQSTQDLERLYVNAFSENLGFHPEYIPSDDPEEDQKRKLIDVKVEEALKLRAEYNKQKALEVAEAVRENQLDKLKQVIVEKKENGVDVSDAERLYQRAINDDSLRIEDTKEGLKANKEFNPSNSTQQAAQLRSIEERENWLLKPSPINRDKTGTGIQYGPDTLEETQRRNDNFQAPFVSVNNGVLTNSRINSTSYSSGQNSARDSRDMENIARDNNRIEELGKKLVEGGLTAEEYTELNDLQGTPRPLISNEEFANADFAKEEGLTAFNFSKISGAIESLLGGGAGGNTLRIAGQLFEGASNLFNKNDQNKQSGKTKEQAVVPGLSEPVTKPQLEALAKYPPGTSVEQGSEGDLYITTNNNESAKIGPDGKVTILQKGKGIVKVFVKNKEYRTNVTGVAGDNVVVYFKKYPKVNRIIGYNSKGEQLMWVLLSPEETSMGKIVNIADNLNSMLSGNNDKEQSKKESLLSGLVTFATGGASSLVSAAADIAIGEAKNSGFTSEDLVILSDKYESVFYGDSALVMDPEIRKALISAENGSSKEDLRYGSIALGDNNLSQEEVVGQLLRVDSSIINKKINKDNGDTILYNKEGAKYIITKDGARIAGNIGDGIRRDQDNFWGRLADDVEGTTKYVTDVAGEFAKGVLKESGFSERTADSILKAILNPTETGGEIRAVLESINDPEKRKAALEAALNYGNEVARGTVTKLLSDKIKESFGLNLSPSDLEKVAATGDFSRVSASVKNAFEELAKHKISNSLSPEARQAIKLAKLVTKADEKQLTEEIFNSAKRNFPALPEEVKKLVNNKKALENMSPKNKRKLLNILKGKASSQEVEHFLAQLEGVGTMADKLDLKVETFLGDVKKYFTNFTPYELGEARELIAARMKENNGGDILGNIFQKDLKNMTPREQLEYALTTGKITKKQYNSLLKEFSADDSLKESLTKQVVENQFNLKELKKVAQDAVEKAKTLGISLGEYLKFGGEYTPEQIAAIKGIAGSYVDAAKEFIAEKTTALVENLQPLNDGEFQDETTGRVYVPLDNNEDYYVLKDDDFTRDVYYKKDSDGNLVRVVFSNDKAYQDGLKGKFNQAQYEKEGEAYLEAYNKGLGDSANIDSDEVSGIIPGLNNNNYKTKPTVNEGWRDYEQWRAQATFSTDDDLKRTGIDSGCDTIESYLGICEEDIVPSGQADSVVNRENPDEKSSEEQVSLACRFIGINCPEDSGSVDLPDENAQVNSLEKITGGELGKVEEKLGELLEKGGNALNDLELPDDYSTIGELASERADNIERQQNNAEILLENSYKNDQVSGAEYSRFKKDLSDLKSAYEKGYITKESYDELLAELNNGLVTARSIEKDIIVSNQEDEDEQPGFFCRNFGVNCPEDPGNVDLPDGNNVTSQPSSSLNRDTAVNEVPPTNYQGNAISNNNLQTLIKEEPCRAWQLGCLTGKLFDGLGSVFGGETNSSAEMALNTNYTPRENSLGSDRLIEDYDPLAVAASGGLRIPSDDDINSAFQSSAFDSIDLSDNNVDGLVNINFNSDVIKFLGKYNPGAETVLFFHGANGSPDDFSEQIKIANEIGKNVVVVNVDHNDPLKDNVQGVIAGLEGLGLGIDEIVAHSAGNRLLIETLIELGSTKNNLLEGANVQGLNPKLFDDKATSHSVGLLAPLVRYFGGPIVGLMDVENPANSHLFDVDNVKELTDIALGDGKINFIIAVNDSQNLTGDKTKGVFDNLIGGIANNITYINVPEGINPHTAVLGGIEETSTGDLFIVSGGEGPNSGTSTIYRNKDGVYQPVGYAPAEATDNNAANTFSPFIDANGNMIQKVDVGFESGQTITTSATNQNGLVGSEVFPSVAPGNTSPIENRVSESCSFWDIPCHWRNIGSGKDDDANTGQSLVSSGDFIPLSGINNPVNNTPQGSSVGINNLSGNVNNSGSNIFQGLPAVAPGNTSPIENRVSESCSFWDIPCHWRNIGSGKDDDANTGQSLVSSGDFIPSSGINNPSVEEVNNIDGYNNDGAWGRAGENINLFNEQSNQNSGQTNVVSSSGNGQQGVATSNNGYIVGPDGVCSFNQVVAGKCGITNPIAPAVSTTIPNVNPEKRQSFMDGVESIFSGRFVEDVLGTGIGRAGNIALSSIADGDATRETIAKIYLDEITDAAIDKVSVELFGDNVLNSVVSNIAQSVNKIFPGETTYERVNEDVTVNNSNSQKDVAPSIDDYINAKYGEQVFDAAADIMKGKDIGDVGQSLLASTANTYVNNSVTEFITTGNVNLFDSFRPATPNKIAENGLFGSSSGTIAKGVATATANVVGQLIRDGRLDLEATARVAGEAVANDVLSSALADSSIGTALGGASGVAPVVGAIVSLGSSLLRGEEITTAQLGSTVASTATNMALTSMTAAATATAGTVGATAITSMSLAAGQTVSTVAGITFVGGGAAGGAAAGGAGWLGSLSSAGPIGIAAAIVGMVIFKILDRSASEAEVKEWQRVARRSVLQPDFHYASLDPESRIARAIAYGNVGKIRQTIQQTINSSAIGQVANIAGLEGMAFMAVGLMTDDVNRTYEINPRDVSNFNFGDDGDLNFKDADIAQLAEEYKILKQHLRNCYVTNNQACVTRTSEQLSNAQGWLSRKVDIQFDESIRAINQEIYKLERDLTTAVGNQRNQINRRLQERKRLRDLIPNASSQIQQVIHGGQAPRQGVSPVVSNSGGGGGNDDGYWDDDEGGDGDSD